ncbi:hypothetical protein H632_c811p0 [Helicosporidium sp. ATCC 50920]|nr:hypothetical protein H632_c811p0 [Helicosporidium sp. ATCC 50920]|eukprot:KDD75204.1 hypothetical protein H632_c811p0 [Helicosporidium sp. ATCC 50920]
MYMFLLMHIAYGTRARLHTATDVEIFCNRTAIPPSPDEYDFLGTMKYAKLPSGDIAYYRFGTSQVGQPALVMVAGFGSTMSTWPLSMLRALAVNQEMVIFDNNNNPSAVITIPGMAQDTMDLVHHLELKRPNLLGVSMGGMIVLTAVALNSSSVDRVISLAGSPGSVNSPRPQPQAIEAILGLSGNIEDEWNLLFNLSTPAGKEAFCNFELEPRISDPSNAETTANQAKGVLEYFVAYNTTYDAMPDLPNDLLLVGGSEDILVPPGGLKYVASVAGYPWLMVLDGGAHAAFVQYLPYMMDIFHTFLYMDTPEIFD